MIVDEWMPEGSAANLLCTIGKGGAFNLRIPNSSALCKLTILEVI
jgi:hypothetical protein